MADHHHLEATPDTVHWGYWDASIKPVLRIRSGDRVTVELAMRNRARGRITRRGGME